jgi:hypothetical protein
VVLATQTSSGSTQKLARARWPGPSPELASEDHWLQSSAQTSPAEEGAGVCFRFLWHPPLLFGFRFICMLVSIISLPLEFAVAIHLHRWLGNPQRIAPLGGLARVMTLLTLCQYNRRGLLSYRATDIFETPYIAISHIWGKASWTNVWGIPYQVLISSQKARLLKDELSGLVGENLFWMDILAVDQSSKQARIEVTEHIPAIYRSVLKTDCRPGRLRISRVLCRCGFALPKSRCRPGQEQP